MSNAPRDARGRRFWGDDDSATPILHIDMDSFFAQVELAEDPSLAGKEIIVGGTSNRGVVTSTTYEARAKGVRAGMPMARARLLCPEARVVPSRRGAYSEYSKRVMAILSSVTPELEQVSIDEAFLDVSGARRRLGSPTSIGRMLRARIREEVGLPASVGIASSKSVAKIASSNAKPDGLLLIPADRTVEFLHGLPVGALWGVGAVSAKRFEKAGIDTIGDLAKLEMSRLSRIVGVANAHRLHDLAWGIDRRRVAPQREEKSIGTEQTFDEDLRTREEVEAFLLKASHECAQRLRAHEWVASTIVLKLRDPAFKTLTRSTTLHAPSDVGRIVFEAVKGLFEREAMPAGGVRLVGVRCEGLCSREEGIAVTLDEDGKPLASERAMDSVLSRFGRNAIAPATLIQRPGGTESLEGHATD